MRFFIACHIPYRRSRAQNGFIHQQEIWVRDWLAVFLSFLVIKCDKTYSPGFCATAHEMERIISVKVLILQDYLKNNYHNDNK